MTLQEAISNLDKQRNQKIASQNLEDANTLSLGIEALKRLQVNRKQTTIEWVTLLPGETKD